jgi:hypothetical protein
MSDCGIQGGSSIKLSFGVIATGLKSMLERFPKSLKIKGIV